MKADRKTGLEYLRIIAMFAIVLGHFMSHSNGFTDATDIKNPLVIAEEAVNSFGLFKVNVFILITGFFMIEKQIDFAQVKEKLLPLWRVVFGYSIGIMIVMLFITRPSFAGIVKSFFPILSYRYWFVTTYFVLILLTPIINRAFINISKEVYRKILIVLLLCFCVWQTIIPFVTTVDDEQGYSIVWFVTVYIIGGYIRKYGLNIVNNKLRIPIYLLTSVLYLIYCIAVEIIFDKTSFSLHIPYYNSIFALIASVALFNFFYNIDIHGKLGDIILNISRSVLAVYLISDNPLIRKVLYSKVLKIDKYINDGIKSILFVLLFALIIFGICLVIDIIRKMIINLFKRMKRKCYE